MQEGLTERKNRTDYFRIKAEVIHILKNAADDIIEVSEIVEMPEKESFGDLDLFYIFKQNRTFLDLKNVIELNFQPNDMVHNGHLLSFDYQNFQIDMIQCTPETYDMSVFCFSFGDRGMILGQIARSCGLSLGAHGLYIPCSGLQNLTNISGVTEKLLLTNDSKLVREFLGLPSSDQNLKTQEDVELFCKSCKYYDPKLFINKRMFNNETKKRLKGRPFYKKFIDKILLELGIPYEDQDNTEISACIFNSLENSQYSEVSDSQYLKSYQLDMQKHALEYFNKADDLKNIEAKYIQRKELKSKLNSTHFIDLGIDNKQVGIARESFAKYILACVENSNAFKMIEETKHENETDVYRCSEFNVSFSKPANNVHELPLAILYEQFNEFLGKESPDVVYANLLKWHKDVWSLP